jgi:hypothetical protein
MLANFTTGLFYRRSRQMVGIYMLINPWRRGEGEGLTEVEMYQEK